MMILRDMKDQRKGNKKLFVTLPTDLEIEIEVIQIAARITQYLLNLKLNQSSIQSDKELLQNLQISYKERFAVIMRLEHK